MDKKWCLIANWCINCCLDGRGHRHGTAMPLS